MIRAPLCARDATRLGTDHFLTSLRTSLYAERQLLSMRSLKVEMLASPSRMRLAPAFAIIASCALMVLLRPALSGNLVNTIYTKGGSLLANHLSSWSFSIIDTDDALNFIHRDAVKLAQLARQAPIPQPPYKVVICTLMHNENRYLDEWLARGSFDPVDSRSLVSTIWQLYHYLLGFDHFILCDLKHFGVFQIPN